jgi:hypothetical protein
VDPDAAITVAGETPECQRQIDRREHYQVVVETDTGVKPIRKAGRG